MDEREQLARRIRRIVKEKQHQGDDFYEEQAQENLGGAYVGGLAKGDRSSAAYQKLQKGREEYQANLRALKAEGLSHKEAQKYLKEHKKSTPRARKSTPRARKSTGLRVSDIPSHSAPGSEHKKQAVKVVAKLVKDKDVQDLMEDDSDYRQKVENLIDAVDQSQVHSGTLPLVQEASQELLDEARGEDREQNALNGSGLKSLYLENLRQGVEGGARIGNRPPALQQYHQRLRMLKSKGLSHKEAQAVMKKAKMQGGNWFSKLMHGVESVIPLASKIIPMVL